MARTTTYHLEIQQASKLANKLNTELDYVNYAHTIQQQLNLTTSFDPPEDEPANQESQQPAKSNASAYQATRNGGAVARGSDSLVLTKFDILDAFKGHGDLVQFLQEHVCTKRRVHDVKQMQLETPSIVKEQQAAEQRQKKLQRLRERKAQLKKILSDCNS